MRVLIGLSRLVLGTKSFVEVESPVWSQPCLRASIPIAGSSEFIRDQQHPQPTHQITHNAFGNFPHHINGRIVCCTKQPPRYLFTVNKKPKTSHLRFPPTDSKSQLSHGQGHQEPRPGFNPLPAPATLRLSRVGRYLIDWHSTLILSRGSHLGIGVKTFPRIDKFRAALAGVS